MQTADLDRLLERMPERERPAVKAFLDRHFTSSAHYLTAGHLRKVLEGVSDDTPVMYQRIEDEYFEQHSWQALFLLWETSVMNQRLLDTLSAEDRETIPVIKRADGKHEVRNMSGYIPAFSAYKHHEAPVVVINAHY